MNPACPSFDSGLPFHDCLSSIFR